MVPVSITFPQPGPSRALISFCFYSLLLHCKTILPNEDESNVDVTQPVWLPKTICSSTRTPVPPVCRAIPALRHLSHPELTSTYSNNASGSLQILGKAGIDLLCGQTQGRLPHRLPDRTPRLLRILLIRVDVLLLISSRRDCPNDLHLSA